MHAGSPGKRCRASSGRYVPFPGSAPMVSVSISIGRQKIEAVHKKQVKSSEIFISILNQTMPPDVIPLASSNLSRTGSSKYAFFCPESMTVSPISPLANNGNDHGINFLFYAFRYAIIFIFQFFVLLTTSTHANINFHIFYLRESEFSTETEERKRMPGLLKVYEKPGHPLFHFRWERHSQVPVEGTLWLLFTAVRMQIFLAMLA